MSTLLTEPETPPPGERAAARLRAAMTAVRVSMSWLGVRKSLSPAQKSQAAESFGAEREFLSAGKKLLDTSHPTFKAATGVRNRIVAYWKGITLPYPEPGLRLIRQDDVTAFHAQMTSHRQALAEVVLELEANYGELKVAARRRLGSLFNASDYPATLAGLFEVSWDYPAVEPP